MTLPVGVLVNRTFTTNTVGKTKPFVSIVTPVYNGERYIRECIESVIGQTYSNWEYVISDNCSSDCTLSIAREYAEKDTRIRVLENTIHLDIIHNWNRALSQISKKSRYCKVVHADDFLYSECVERMVEVAEANPTVGMVGAFRSTDSGIELNTLPTSTPVISGREICRSYLLYTGRLGGTWVFGSPTSLLIRSDFVREKEKFYNEENIHADTEVCCEILQDADFGFVHDVLTYNRDHAGRQTALNNEYNTYLLSDLNILLKYGHVYLNVKELNRCINRKLNQYYEYLGRCLFKKKEEEFWNYHKEGLDQAGYPMSYFRLIIGMLKSGIKLFVYPGLKLRKPNPGLK